MTAKQLEKKYGRWSSHPDIPVEDWKSEVANGDTRLGYWEWVSNALGG